MLDTKFSMPVASAHEPPILNWSAVATQSGAQFANYVSPNHNPDQFIAVNLTLLKQDGLFSNVLRRKIFIS